VGRVILRIASRPDASHDAWPLISKSEMCIEFDKVVKYSIKNQDNCTVKNYRFSFNIHNLGLSNARLLSDLQFNI